MIKIPSNKQNTSTTYYVTWGPPGNNIQVWLVQPNKQQQVSSLSCN